MDPRITIKRGKMGLWRLRTNYTPYVDGVAIAGPYDKRKDAVRVAEEHIARQPQQDRDMTAELEAEFGPL